MSGGTRLFSSRSAGLPPDSHRAVLMQCRNVALGRKTELPLGVSVPVKRSERRDQCAMGEAPPRQLQQPPPAHSLVELLAVELAALDNQGSPSPTVASKTKGEKGRGLGLWLDPG